MVVKIYVSGISGNKEVKKKQQRVQMILDSKSISYEAIDITEPGKEKEKETMQQKAKVREALGKHPLPPQLFNEEEYCGDYDDFDMANEVDQLEAFLHLPIPSKLSADDSVSDKLNGSREDSDGIQNGGSRTEINGDVVLSPVEDDAGPSLDGNGDSEGAETAEGEINTNPDVAETAEVTSEVPTEPENEEIARTEEEVDDAAADEAEEVTEEQNVSAFHLTSKEVAEKPTADLRKSDGEDRVPAVETDLNLNILVNDTESTADNREARVVTEGTQSESESETGKHFSGRSTPKIDDFASEDSSTQASRSETLVGSQSLNSCTSIVDECNDLEAADVNDTFVKKDARTSQAESAVEHLGEKDKDSTAAKSASVAITENILHKPAADELIDKSLASPTTIEAKETVEEGVVTQLPPEKESNFVSVGENLPCAKSEEIECNEVIGTEEDKSAIIETTRTLEVTLSEEENKPIEGKLEQEKSSIEAISAPERADTIAEVQIGKENAAAESEDFANKEDIEIEFNLNKHLVDTKEAATAGEISDVLPVGKSAEIKAPKEEPIVENIKIEEKVLAQGLETSPDYEDAGLTSKVKIEAQKQSSERAARSKEQPPAGKLAEKNLVPKEEPTVEDIKVKEKELAEGLEISTDSKDGGQTSKVPIEAQKQSSEPAARSKEQPLLSKDSKITSAEECKKLDLFEEEQDEIRPLVRRDTLKQIKRPSLPLIKSPYRQELATKEEKKEEVMPARIGGLAIKEKEIKEAPKADSEEPANRQTAIGVPTKDIMFDMYTPFNVDRIKFTPQLVAHHQNPPNPVKHEGSGVALRKWDRRPSEIDVVKEVRTILDERDTDVAISRARARAGLHQINNPHRHFIGQMSKLISDIEGVDEIVDYQVVHPPPPPVIKEPTPPPPVNEFLEEVLRALNAPWPPVKKSDNIFLKQVKDLVNSDQLAGDGNAVYFTKEKFPEQEAELAEKVRVILDDRESSLGIVPKAKVPDHSEFLGDVLLLLNDEPIVKDQECPSQEIPVIRIEKPTAVPKPRVEVAPKEKVIEVAQIFVRDNVYPVIAKVTTSDYKVLVSSFGSTLELSSNDLEAVSITVVEGNGYKSDVAKIVVSSNKSL